MKISRNTFETFIVTWIWRARLPPLPNPVDPGPDTQPVQLLLDVSWRVQHSPLDGHFFFHSETQRRGHSDTFPCPALVTESAHVYDLAEHPDRPHSIPVSYSRLFHVIIITHHLGFQLVHLHQLEFQPQQIIARTCAQQLIHVYAEKNVSCLMLKHPWVSNRLLEFHVQRCLPEMVLPDHRGISSSIHGTFKFSYVTTRCGQGVLRRQLDVQRPPGDAVQEGCLPT